MEDAIRQAGDLFHLQFGFRKARSTVDAISLVTGIARNAIEGSRWRGGSKEYCIVVTLDIKNAFNSANWNCILESLRRFHIPSYLMGIIGDYNHINLGTSTIAST